MATLYVTQPGTQVRKVDERLVLMRGEEILEDIPLIKVDRVILMGRGVSLTTPAMFALAKRGVDVVYLAGSGRYVSRVVGSEHKHGRLRHTQSLLVADPAFSLRLAAAIVAGKISNQRTLVRRHAEGAGWARQALEGMDAMMGLAGTARTLDELRGFEGRAAREYFSLLRRMLNPPPGAANWGFEKRAYYPPTDPVNALLSFGYTLLLNDMIAACEMVGLDPYLGCFHAIDYGRPSMALDLIEEFRPIVVDSIILGALNRGVFRLQDFRIQGKDQQDEEDGNPAEPSRAVLLSESARTRFLAIYEERSSDAILYPPTQERTAYRRVFSLQAEQMARLILGETNAYQFFTVR